MGNGLDAVLVGYSGSMVAEKVGVDRCAWYKTDRYYPEDLLVKVAGRFPMKQQLEHAENSGWFELAPLGRTWYEVFSQGQHLEIQASSQKFVPQDGVLYSELDFGLLQARVTTFLHCRESLLVEHYEFSQKVELRGWMAPGVWVEEGWDTSPFRSVEMASGATTGSYNLGETYGMFFLHMQPASSQVLESGLERGLVGEGRTFTRYFSILDNRQCELCPAAFERAIAPGYEALFQEHRAFWGRYFSYSHISIPDTQFQYFYDASLYHFKAAQNRISGGLPVNNLRRTWSSHVFWDSYFIQRALLEANRRAESLEACRFFQRTLEHARRHARQEFGCQGLKWDWEITHDGRKAYGTLLHMKFQVHNNASYANEIWQYYQFTQDLDFLAEFLPILKGLAEFFMEGVVEHTSRGWEIGPLVGVSENPIKVKNEGMSLAGTIVILEHYANAARLLGMDDQFIQKCLMVIEGLRKTLNLLYTGEYFVSAEGASKIAMSSDASIYPMQVIPFSDERSLKTSRAVLAYNLERSQREGVYYNFPWSWGVLGTIFARQRDGETAWQIIQKTRPTLCEFGGMTEVMEGCNWNMQYFLTAEGAVSTALHNLLLQEENDRILVFPARPVEWQNCSFERLLASGLEVSAAYTPGHVSGMVKNIAHRALTRQICWEKQVLRVTLEPGGSQVFKWVQASP